MKRRNCLSSLETDDGQLFSDASSRSRLTYAFGDVLDLGRDDDVNFGVAGTGSAQSIGQLLVRLGSRRGHGNSLHSNDSTDGHGSTENDLV